MVALMMPNYPDPPISDLPQTLDHIPLDVPEASQELHPITALPKTWEHIYCSKEKPLKSLFC